MSTKEMLFKYRKLIIIILLFLVVFSIRAEAVNIGGVPDQSKSLYQDQNGLPYFSEMDSYYNLRLTQDYLNHGYLGRYNDKWNRLGSSFILSNRSECRISSFNRILTAFTYKFVNHIRTCTIKCGCHLDSTIYCFSSSYTGLSIST